MNIDTRAVLHDDVEIPYLGLGTYQASASDDLADAVAHALNVGYRHIDTAEMYRNEAQVGKGIKSSGIDREDVFITSKVWPSHFQFDETLEACQKSLDRLGTDYLDLYLLHWPGRNHLEAWEALVDLKRQDLVRSIGISNFSINDIKEILSASEVVPTVNQVEFHPFNFKDELLEYCRSKHIMLEAYSPLTRGRKFDHSTVRQLSEKYDKSPAQVLIRWVLQHDVIVIPKSTHMDRIEENADVFDFELSDEDMRTLDALDAGLSVL